MESGKNLMENTEFENNDNNKKINKQKKKKQDISYNPKTYFLLNI